MKARGSCTDYDPRFRPWYVVAASKPKAVVIIIDSSGSMQASNRWQKAKDATNVVLDTLGPDDLVTIIDFDKDAKLPPSSPVKGYGKCLSTQLVPASTAYKTLLKRWVESMDPQGTTNFIAAFNLGFQALKATDINQGGVTRVPTILFMTDGDANDPTKDINAARDSISDYRLRPKIFTFVFGSGITSKIRALMAKIAADNDGASMTIADSADLRTAMGSYYDHRAFTFNSTTPLFTVPYFDASGLGLVTTAAVQVQSTTGKLLGVAGVDLSMDDLMADVNCKPHTLRRRGRGGAPRLLLSCVYACCGSVSAQDLRCFCFESCLIICVSRACYRCCC
jgi:hypothetical protein